MITTKLLALLLGIFFINLLAVHVNGNDLVAAWKEINQNNVHDIQQTTRIYNKIREEHRSLAELRTIVERQLRTENSELLANTIVSLNAEDARIKLREILQSIMEQYDKSLIDDIFAETLNEVSVRKKLPELPDILWGIYKNGDAKLFEIMLRAQLQLYSNFRCHFHADERTYFYKFAYRLSKIKQNPLYKELDEDLKADVESLQKTLPNNVKYLFFAPYFCLQNAFYSKYMYTATSAKIDSISRYVWLWHDNNSMDDTGFIRADIEEFNPKTDKQIKVSLQSTKYQKFYYMMPNTKTIASWDSPNTPINNIWEIEFLDGDRVAFIQDNHLMCATTPHDGARRNVGGKMKGSISSSNAECQWRLGECRFIN